jgi:small-conductance mechanosensitive channel
MEPNILYALITIITGLCIAGLAHFIILWLKRKAEKTDTMLDNIVLHAVGRPLVIAIMVITVYVALTEFVMEPEELFWTLGGRTVFGYQFINAAFILLGAWIASGFAHTFISTYGDRLAAQAEGRVDNLMMMLELISKYVIWFVAFLMVLSVFEIDITALLAGAGIGAIAIALAAQEIIGNFLGGAIITLDKPFRVGDRIKYDTYIGDIISIGPRSTRMKTLDYQIVTIPNSKLTSNVITNYAMPDVRLKVRIPFSVAYGSDIKRVKAILLEIANEAIDKTPWAVPDPKPSVYFLEFGDSSLNGQLILFTDEYTHLWDVQDYINIRIDERFREEGIEIPFRQVDVHMRGQENGTGKSA